MNQDKALVPQPETGLATTSTTLSPVIRRMTDGVLDQARKTQIQQVRFRVGNYALREPDYRQICLWAEELAMTPDELLAVLAKTCYSPKAYMGMNPIEFKLNDGSLHCLVWDLDRLPRFPDKWVRGLRLDTLAFVSAKDGTLPVVLSLAPDVPSLRRLRILKPGFKTKALSIRNLNLAGVPQLLELALVNTNLTDLDLSPVPKLTKLYCKNNKLTELDLTPVPRLTKLGCISNELAELDLSPVPELTELSCLGNYLTKLDLTHVSKLTKLNCSYNQLTELDLTPVPELTELSCFDNKLTELDLTPVPKLTELDCSYNHLTELDLTPVPKLTELDCLGNQLTELDLTPVPKLTKLSCSGNQFTKLDLAPVTHLHYLRCDRQLVLHNAKPDLEIDRK